MSDLISREEAREALQNEIDKGIPPFNDTKGAIRCGLRLARNIIEDLPAADTCPYYCELIPGTEKQCIKIRHEWIPVTERLPEKPGIYLVTILNREWVKGDIVQGAKPPKDDHWESHANLYAERPDGKWVEVTQRAFMNSVRPTWSGYGEEVLAWMPLPEPYKGEK